MVTTIEDREVAEPRTSGELEVKDLRDHALGLVGVVLAA
jgi:hypothetical protein